MPLCGLINGVIRFFFSYDSNLSGGVAICFNNCRGEFITYKADGSGHWLMVVLKIDGLFSHFN